MKTRHLLPARALRGTAIAACLVLASCATPRESTSKLQQAAEFQRSAGSPSRDLERFVVSNLRAAELASEPSEEVRRATEIRERSTSALAEWALTAPPGRKTYTYAGASYSLQIPDRIKPGMVRPAALRSVKPASRVPRTLVKVWESRAGQGVPLAARWRTPNDARLASFVPDRGYMMPVTALLEFPPSRSPGKPKPATLEFLDPTVLRDIPGGKSPLAADFSAPIVDQTRDIRELLIALEGLIDPEVHDARLYLLQPYNPNKTPVVLVHGLMSHPRMWRDVLNELIADPAVSSRYQFWVYYYPTGWPILYSAMRLREDLRAVDQALGRQKHIVLVGHSMGGLLSRLQAVSPGDALARANIAPDKWEKYRSLPPDHIGKRTFEFQANPAIDRIVFISTPHRGSKVADWSLSTWFTKFIRLPSKITSAAIDIIPSIVKTPEKYSSISRLSPSNPLYKMLERFPIQAPHHSIIGDRGRGDTPDSSDGVVAYWSSHLDSAESEVIVPDDHGSFDDPAAIAELKRILLKNRGLSAGTKSAQRGL